MAAWIDLTDETDRAFVRQVWTDAPINDEDEADPDDLTLATYLGAAQEQCEAFAPELPQDDPIPDRYRLAVVMQARGLWQASVVTPDGTVGAEGFTIRVHPMDWNVKNLLRPKRPIGYFG